MYDFYLWCSTYIKQIDHMFYRFKISDRFENRSIVITMTLQTLIYFMVCLAKIRQNHRYKKSSDLDEMMIHFITYIL